MTKKKKISLICITTVIVLLLSAVLIYYFGASYPYYASVMQKEIAIPGLEEGFTPQGLDFDEESQNYLISGYMKDTSKASRIYVVNKYIEEEVKYVTLYAEGEALKGHFGGVTVSGDTGWVASDGKIFRFDLESLLQAPDGTEIETLDHFETNNGADSVTAHGGILWVGEFYKKGKYETDQSHHIETEDGDVNRALALGYEIDENEAFGLIDAIPDKGLSLPNEIQGFEFLENGRIVLSKSYSIPDSHIYVYKYVLDEQAEETVIIDGNSVSVYVLSASDLVKDIVAPAMSEEIVFVDGRLNILYESACQKYKWVNRTRTRNVQSILIEG